MMGRVVALAVGILVYVSAISFAATPNRQRSIFEDEPAERPARPVTVAPPMPPAPPRARQQPGETPAPKLVEGAVTKSPVPSDEAQRAAEQLVREIFRSEYTDASDPGRQALARKLLAQAPQTDDLAERFVLLRESAEVAAAGGDLQAAEHALDHIPANFDSDGRQYRVAAYQRLMARPELVDAVVQACLDAADRAIEAEQFDAAEQYLQVTDAAGAAAGGKPNPPALASAVAGKRNAMRARRATTQQVAAARETLKRDPKDAAALAAVGRHLCLTHGDWLRGLPMLAESGDARLKPAAEAELKAIKSANPAEQLEAANLWWALRREFTGVEGGHIAAHTAAMYQAIAPNLSGLRKTLAEKRVAELRRATDPAMPDGAAMALEPAPPGARRARRSGSGLIGPSSVVFVCDASGSMLGQPFDLVKGELRKAVDALEPHQSFEIVFFRKGGYASFSDKDLLRADAPNKAAAYEWIARQQVASNSDPVPGLKRALALRPQMVYLLTDGAFDNNDAVVAELRQNNVGKRTRISTIAFFAPDAPPADREKCEEVLTRIAADHGGRFRVVLTTDLTR